MAAPKEAPDAARKATFRAVSSGLLYRDETGGTSVLVLQCRQRVDRGGLQKAKKYFTTLHAGVPWTKVRIMRLGESDEGDAEDAASEPETEEDEAGAPEAADVEREEDILDEWDEAATEPAAAEAAPDAAEAPPTPAEDDGARQAAADRVARLVLEKAPKLVPPGADAAFRERIAELLEHISPDRLLLALCYSSNLEQVAVGPEDARSKTPVANDDAGHAEIANGLAAFGERVARERGFLAPGETAQADARLRTMVKDTWRGNPRLSSEEILQKLIGVLGPTFQTMDASRVRPMLGLKGAKPEAAAPGSVPGSAPGSAPEAVDAAPAWQDGLRAARAGWERDASGAVAGVAQVKDQIRSEFSNDPAAHADVAAAFAELDKLTGRLANGFAAVFDQVLDEPEESRREGLRRNAAAAVSDMRSFLETDGLAANLDGNEWVPSLRVIAPLLGRLQDMQAALAQASAGGR
jgi:hypothetical protein